MKADVDNRELVFNQGADDHTVQEEKESQDQIEHQLFSSDLWPNWSFYILKVMYILVRKNLKIANATEWFVAT